MARFTLKAGVVGSALVLFAALAAPVRSDDTKTKGFVDLFDGKSFAGWKFHLEDSKADPAKTWSIKDGVIICTGHPAGFIYTAKSYHNYRFRYDWMYPRPEGLKDDEKFDGNSGALMHIQNPLKGVIGVWPNCVEVQGMNKRHGELLFIPRDQGKGKYDIEAKRKATHAVGEWNTTEIVCTKGMITALINDKEVSSGQGELREGMIGFQSEGAEIHFRKIQIKELAAD